MANAADWGADENTFSNSFAEYYLDEPNILQQVDAQNIQDPELSETLHDISAFARENNAKVTPQKPVADDDIDRWRNLTNGDVDNYQKEAHRPKTHRQTKWGVNVFRDWLRDTGRDIYFEQMSAEVLAENLRHFYPSARAKDGKAYQKQTLINIRSAISRHLSLPPHNKNWDLMNDPQFKTANMVFAGNLRVQKQQGLIMKRKKRPPISKEHLEQVYTNYFDPHWENDPQCLQHKIFFDINYYLGNRGREGLRDLQKTDFELKTNDKGEEYFELKYDQATKKAQGDEWDDHRFENYILLSQPNSHRCPVKSFKFYLSKLTDIPQLFQQANPCYKFPTDRWYNRSPCGVNTIGAFLSQISSASGLSKRYTNHSICGTTATGLKHKEKNSTYDIAQHLGHRNVQSLQYYLDRPDQKKKEKHSKDLFNYLQPDGEENENSDDDFEPPPPPKKKANATKLKKKTSSTVSTPPPEHNPDAQALQVFDGNNDTIDIPTSQSNNYMAMYKQNPVGMFVGANLSNCTININMPK